MFAQQRVGEVTVDGQSRERNIQTFPLPLRSPLRLPDSLPRLVVPSRSLGAVRHGEGERGAGLGVPAGLAHHPVVGSLDLLLAVVGVEQQAGPDGNICSSASLGGRLVLLASGGVVTKPDTTWG